MGYASFSTIDAVLRDGILRASLDNGPLNLMDEAMFADLTALAGELEQDDAVRVLVVDSANPDFFCAHADVSQWTGGLEELPPPSAEPNPYQTLFERFRNLPQATIAVVSGRARGGGVEFALSLDMRFADRDRAVFAQPEVGLGAMPGFGATQYLPLLIGRGRALELVLGGDDVDAEVAAAYGIFNRALPADELSAFVDALAARIASFPPSAIRAAKAADDAQVGDLTAGLLAENDGLMRTLVTSEVPRRMSLFLERGGQTPEFEADLGEHMPSLAV